jgi:hypothetical protein
MFKVLEYYGRFQGVRGQLVALPGWARGLIFVAALPGVLLISLSILVLLVSILALLLLTVPLYRVLKALVGTTVPQQQPTSPSDFFEGFTPATEDLTPSPGRKKVDVTIIETPNA